MKFLASKIGNRSATVDLKVSIMVRSIVNNCDWISTTQQLADRIISDLKEMHTKQSYTQPEHTVKVEHHPDQEAVEVWRVDQRGEKKYMMWRIVKV